MSEPRTLTHAEPPVAHQFDDAPQERLAATLGMWTFLVTEVLFFGGLFVAYTVYRATYPAAFAEASHHLYLSIGGTNTAVLLISSLLMALAVHASQTDQKRRAIRLMLGTIALGVVFLILKATEYTLDYHDALVPGPRFHASEFTDPRHAQLMLVFYWIMTGLHAAHVTAGVLVIGILSRLVSRAETVARYRNAVEMVGLYWHFVDIVWLFLLPLLYMARV